MASDTTVRADEFWVLCERLIENDPKQRFKNFVERNAKKNWFFSSDYVIADSTRPNDCLCFTVYPIDERNPTALWKEIPAILTADLKKIKNLSDDAIAFLRQETHFSICIVLTKDRYSGDDREIVRLAIRQLLDGMHAWKDANQQKAFIVRVQKLERSAAANNFKSRLMRDMFLVTSIASVIAYLLTKWTNPRTVGWFSDRDNMISAYDGIAHGLFAINHGSICQHRDVEFRNVQLRYGNPLPDPKYPTQSWYDAIIRIPDYLAGTLAAYNYRENVTSGQKASEMVRGVFVNAANSLVITFERQGNLLQPAYIEITPRQK
jgi:hypothetical protein